VQLARRAQAERGALNSRLPAGGLIGACGTSRQSLALLRKAARSFGLSARACHRVVRVARTIADLAGSEALEADHLAEALTLRRIGGRPADSAARRHDTNHGKSG
ncbi:MAG: YifB family Mg chelatase-like AAA ATPase, partial [Gammaproteobacteria bacterium]